MTTIISSKGFNTLKSLVTRRGASFTYNGMQFHLVKNLTTAINLLKRFIKVPEPPKNLNYKVNLKINFAYQCTPYMEKGYKTCNLFYMRSGFMEDFYSDNTIVKWGYHNNSDVEATGFEDLREVLTSSFLEGDKKPFKTQNKKILSRCKTLPDYNNTVMSIRKLLYLCKNK